MTTTRSRNRFTWFLPLFLLVFGLAPTAEAQEPVQLTGSVMDAAGQPIASANVQIQGMRLGTTTNQQGRFLLVVPADRAQGQEVTVSASLIGRQTASQTVTLQPGSQISVEFTLQTQALALEGLVVTALGIERQERALGYSIQDLGVGEIADVPSGNFISNLSGEIAGAQIKNSPYPGGSARILLRGANSLQGENQPLIVIDGVPIDNSSSSDTEGGATGNAIGGFDYGNAASMIDPNQIASISVLKGANAAALYGSRASNGAIVIETKSGRSGEAGLTVTQTVEMSNPLRLPQYQNSYGQGSAGGTCAYTSELGCEAQFRWVDGAGGGVYDYLDESWGPPLNGQPIDQFTGAQQPWEPHPDNVRNFFETGLTSRTSASFNGRGETSHGRISLTYENHDGMAPGAEIEKTTAMLRGGIDLSDRFSIDATAQYFREVGERRPGTGYDDRNIMQQFVWFGRQVDVQALEDWECEEGIYACDNAGDADTPDKNWNYNYHDNPYFLQFGHNNQDETDRLVGSVAAAYDFNTWLTASVRTGVDWYRDHRKREYHPGSQFSPDGSFGENHIYRREVNSSAQLSGSGIGLSEDVSLSFNAGVNLRSDHDELEYVDVGQLNVPGIYTTSNAAATPIVEQEKLRKRVYSTFGDVEVGFRDYAFLSFTGRNDWSSTLPEENRSYFYPSVSGSFIFTDAFELDSDVLTYGKLRGSWAEVGNDTDPYQLQPTFSLETRWGGTAGYAVPDELPNADLRPESTESWEAGADLEFFNGRGSLSYTWYRQTTTDQILPVQVSSTTGYDGQVLNAGTIRNQGHEIRVNARPIQRQDFSWDVGVNWAKNDNEVLSLYEDLETLVLGSLFALNLEARVGEPYGTLYGIGFKRDEQGRQIVADAGFGPFPVTDPETRALGNINPDWTGSISNRFRYGNFDLSVLFDFQQGGSLFSGTRWFGLWTGILDETMEGRENGPCDPGILVEGVNEAGESVSGRICPEAYHLYRTIGTGLNHEIGIIDASFIKLREARLTYQVPGEWAGRAGLSGATVSLIGRNLWLGSEARHLDPDFAVTSGNIQGFEHGQMPTPRTFGLTVTVTP